MSKDTLKLVLTDHWFEEIKSGRKTHEYRKASAHWVSRFGILPKPFYKDDFIKAGYEYNTGYEFVEFQKAYRKNPERMLFEIKNIGIVDGKNTDLKVDKWVFDIELGERIDE